ncbi:MAG: hypothetical protein U5L96_16725 [Owenweeksia sp.]|nr:hypothetical protein [Owenweeksia sp.]
MQSYTSPSGSYTWTAAGTYQDTIPGFPCDTVLTVYLKLADTIYVNDNSTAGDVYTTAIGDDNNPGTADAPLATLQKAVDTVCDNGVIIIDAGIYNQDLLVNRDDLTIIGAGIDVSTIDHSGQPGHGNAGIHVLANGVIIKGITVTGDNTVSVPRYGLKVGTSSVTTDDVVLDSVKVTNSFRTGFDLARPKNLSLKNVFAINNGGAGIFMSNAEGVNLENITTAGNPWIGVSIATRRDWPGNTSGIYFTGSNSFDESNGKNGGVQIESDETMLITWSNDSTDGADVTIQQSELAYTLSGPTTNTFGSIVYAPYFRFFETLAQAQSAAGLSPDHVDKPRYIRDANSSNTPAATHFHVFDFADTAMTIQAAVDAAVADNTVNIDVGEFEEQIEIDKNLNLIGQGQGVTIILGIENLPLFFTTTNDNYPLIYAHDASTVNIKDLTLDGDGQGGSNYRYVGLGYNNAGGTIDNLEIKGFRNTPFNGTQHGVGILADATAGTIRNLTIKDCYLHDIQKTAIALFGADLIASTQNNTVVGTGPTSVNGQNGIQYYGLQSGDITGNIIRDFDYTGATYTASGIITFQNLSPIAITENDMDDNQSHIYHYDGELNAFANDISGGDYGVLAYSIAGAMNASVQNNFFEQVEYSIVGYAGSGASIDMDAQENSITNSGSVAILSYGPTVNITADCNWYGSADPVTFNPLISGLVNFQPFLTDGTDNSGDAGFQPVPGSCNGIVPCDTLYVNDGNTTGDVYTSATGDDNNTGSASDPLASIQKAYR